MADGHLNKCKECNKTDVKENRVKRIDYYRDYDHQRGYHGDGKNSHRTKYPKQHKAHQIIARAMRNGMLKGKCFCGRTDTHAHHDDYNFPLKIRWLCPVHHKEWHDKHGEALNRE